MTPLFTARNGSVLFDGRPIGVFTGARVRSEMIRRALNADQKSRAFEVWMNAVDALIAAQADAAEQQREAA